MTVTSLERLNPAVAVRSSLWLRIYTIFMAWQDRRAQREIDRHAHLLVGHKAAFVVARPAIPIAARPRHGTPC